jgi:hypothetical protein
MFSKNINNNQREQDKNINYENSRKNILVNHVGLREMQPIRPLAIKWMNLHMTIRIISGL